MKEKSWLDSAEIDPCIKCIIKNGDGTITVVFHEGHMKKRRVKS